MTSGSQHIGEHWKIKNQTAAQLIECLGNVEFETLIAKVLEAHGCFVPACRGGCIQDVDLFAHNDTSHNLDLEGFKIGAGSSAAIQIKTWSNGFVKPASVDYSVGFDVKGPGCFGPEWVLRQVAKCLTITAWLKRSLNWLPTKLLA